MPLLDTPEAEQWRTILFEQASTAHNLKLARAAAIRRHIDLKAAEMWARVDQETITEAAVAWQADVEAKVLWAVYGGRPAQEPADL